MASLETIGPLINGMKKRPDTIGLACEAINRMFQKEQSELVAQVSNFLDSYFREGDRHTKQIDFHLFSTDFGFPDLAER